MNEGRQLRIRLESEPPWSRHGEVGLIGVMRHDEQVSEGEIPAHDPLGILEERTVNSLSNGLCSPLISLDEDSPVHLIIGQRVYSLLQPGDDIADCECRLARTALRVSKGIVHSASLPGYTFRTKDWARRRSRNRHGHWCRREIDIHRLALRRLRNDYCFGHPGERSNRGASMPTMTSTPSRPPRVQWLIDSWPPSDLDR